MKARKENMSRRVRQFVCYRGLSGACQTSGVTGNERDATSVPEYQTRLARKASCRRGGIS